MKEPTSRRGGRRGDSNREKLSTRIDRLTRARLDKWKSQKGDGDTIDRMGEHCARTNFNPSEAFNPSSNANQ